MPSKQFVVYRLAQNGTHGRPGPIAVETAEDVETESVCASTAYLEMMDVMEMCLDLKSVAPT